MTVFFLDSSCQCFGRAIEVDPESGYSKYMNMGQLMGGAEAIKCFSRGLELMLNEQQQQTQEVRSFLLVSALKIDLFGINTVCKLGGTGACLMCHTWS